MTIYVKNINPKTTEKRLRRIFEKFRKVNSVIVALENKFGVNTAYCYVEMINIKEAIKAIFKLNGSFQKRNIIRVLPATILKRKFIQNEI